MTWGDANFEIAPDAALVTAHVGELHRALGRRDVRSTVWR